MKNKNIYIAIFFLIALAVIVWVFTEKKQKSNTEETTIHENAVNPIKKEDKEQHNQTIHKTDSITEEKNTEIASTSTLSSARILNKGNVLEIYHPFQNSQLKGDSVYPNLENTTGAMLSAYSFDKGEYDVFYREKIKQEWGEWKQLIINEEVNNPQRKVYEATNINNNVNFLQFKSSKDTKSEVVFRLYRFPKN